MTLIVQAQDERGGRGVIICDDAAALYEAVTAMLRLGFQSVTVTSLVHEEPTNEPAVTNSYTGASGTVAATRQCDCIEENVACDHDAGFRDCGHCSLCGNRVWWNECDRRGLPRLVLKDGKSVPNDRPEWYRR